MVSSSGLVPRLSWNETDVVCNGNHSLVSKVQNTTHSWWSRWYAG